MKKKIGRIKKAAAAAACVCILGTVTAFAAWKYLAPADIAERLADEKLSRAFEGGEAVLVNETQEYSGYRITFLGAAAGKNISVFLSEDGNGGVKEDRLYAAVAIERADGTPMPDTSSDEYGDESFFVSPFVEGLNPVDYNIASMGGSYSELVENGIQYRLIEVSNLEIFADRKLYLGISSSSFYDRNAYAFDKDTGGITRNEDYKGVNALFVLPLDPQKADPQAAEKFLEELRASWEAPSETLEQNQADMDVGEWLSKVNGENLSEYARRVESTVQLVEKGADGMYRYSWEYDGGSGSGASAESMMPEGEAGTIFIVGSGYSVGLEDLLIDTLTVNGDGTFTFALYEPILSPPHTEDTPAVLYAQ